MWEELVFTVSYDLNGGQGNRSTSQTYNGSPLTLDEAKSITKGELYFVGWSTKKDDETSKVASPYTPTGNVTLYALWTDNIFAFDAQKGAITGIDNKYADRYTEKNLTRVTIPSTINGVAVTTLLKNSFFDYPALTNVKISSGVTEIGVSSFWGCGLLTSVTLPNTIKGISGGLFYDCKSLTRLILPNDLITIGGLSFKNCLALKDLAIPSSVKSIGFKAFENCSKLTLTFSSSSIPALYGEIGSKDTKGVEENTFSGVASIRVPKAQLAAYQLKWPKVSSIITGY